MIYNNENALAEVKNFTLPTMIESDFSNEDLSEDFDGLQMSFQRVKIPAGGALQFEKPGIRKDAEGCNHLQPSGRRLLAGGCGV